MKQYTDILDNLLSNGHQKKRPNGLLSLSIFGETFRHEMINGFPLVEGRIHIDSIERELQAIISSKDEIPPADGYDLVIVGNRLNLAWYQAEAELIGEVPKNIALHGALLLLLSKFSNLAAGTLHGTFAECYISDTQIDAAEHLVSQDTSPLPLIGVKLHAGAPQQKKQPSFSFEYLTS